MSGFQIRNDIGATVFAILSGISALFLTAWVFSPGGCAGPKDPPITPIPLSSEDTSGLHKKLAEAKASLTAESERRAELAGELRLSRADAAKLGALKAEFEAKSATLSEANAALKAKLNAGAPEAGKLSALQAQLADFKTSSADLNIKIDQLSAEKASLTKKLAAATAAAAAAKATAPMPAPKVDTGKLDALKAETEKLKKQLADEKKACAKSKAAMAGANEKLKKEIEKLKQQIDEALYGEKLKAAADLPALDFPFLINEPIQLDGKVRPVFIELRGMEDTPEALEKVYATLSKDGNTNALHRVPFDSGSAEVTPAEVTRLNELLKGSPKGARFLVVGYASTDGDAKSNHELSSKRASNVAAQVAGIPGVDKNGVQAVYFGQTKRFNANYLSPNRVVEVWRVK
ncbi:MAG: OmpA family protein [Verrucomicrobiales bacterium]|nr:OmpA family protein [Verrucomicrobiales bacterium]